VPVRNPDLTGIVLAGGGSRRMGTNKAFVEVGGVPMIQRVLQALRECCAEVIIAAKHSVPYRGMGVRVVLDESALQAPLVGIITGLRAARTPWAFMAACDLPYLSPAAVRLLADLAAGHEAAVPRVHGLWHPVHAVYATSALPVLDAQFAAGVRQLASVLKALRVRQVSPGMLEPADPTLRTLWNVNTAREYGLLPGEETPGAPGRGSASGRR
jgi:molybdopterin-guanine dinucleotide biosynthesis protein A